MLVYGRRLFGRNVNIACRLQQAAQPGETLVSGSVQELLTSHGIRSVARVGDVPLKGTAIRIDAYRVANAPHLAIAASDVAATCDAPARCNTVQV